MRLNLFDTNDESLHYVDTNDVSGIHDCFHVIYLF